MFSLSLAEGDLCVSIEEWKDWNLRSSSNKLVDRVKVLSEFFQTPVF